METTKKPFYKRWYGIIVLSFVGLIVLAMIIDTIHRVSDPVGYARAEREKYVKDSIEREYKHIESIKRSDADKAKAESEKAANDKEMADLKNTLANYQSNNNNNSNNVNVQNGNGDKTETIKTKESEEDVKDWGQGINQNTYSKIIVGSTTTADAVLLLGSQSTTLYTTTENGVYGELVRWKDGDLIIVLALVNGIVVEKRKSGF